MKSCDPAGRDGESYSVTRSDLTCRAGLSGHDGVLCSCWESRSCLIGCRDWLHNSDITSCLLPVSPGTSGPEPLRVTQCVGVPVPLTCLISFISRCDAVGAPSCCARCLLGFLSAPASFVRVWFLLHWSAYCSRPLHHRVKSQDLHLIFVCLYYFYGWTFTMLFFQFGIKFKLFFLVSVSWLIFLPWSWALIFCLDVLHESKTKVFVSQSVGQRCGFPEGYLKALLWAFTVISMPRVLWWIRAPP